ncbi:stage III sporulation protein AA [Paenibacillus selenitireducens]|uniref:Stage III sporulation protein AA n=1 Tax=Paenibacillus selenitireducens TaxID=1324314 RepID=A0A1T2XNB0_9BACL|nr:stage III sporulation protein AA [Paenibacillus selenitireducens]OPA81331.1 stage III sporulation protein AA [Paenibacillus selenitireducens]
MKTTTWLSIFPSTIQELLGKLHPTVLARIEEIRVRQERPLEVNYQGQFHYVNYRGELTDMPGEGYLPTREDGNRLLDFITNHSLYTMEEELRKGYITIHGGHRIGLTGRAVLTKGHVDHIRDITSFNIRIARELKGVGEPILPQLLDFRQHSVQHTLILSPPQHGKTTLIRDLARLISGGQWMHAEAKWKGLKVGIVDERSEIAGCLKGVPSFDVGPRTDVLDGCPKAEGMMMMIRSMSPDVMLVDEIGRPEDADAIREALHAGIRVIATAHGSELEDVLRRPVLNKLISDELFQTYVVLHRSSKGTVNRLYDAKRRLLHPLAAGVKGGSYHA